jgi:hypothetical protein
MKKWRDFLIEKAQKFAASLGDAGCRIQCYSVSGDGIATTDCDIAIDVTGFHSDVQAPKELVSIQVDPYHKKDFTLKRLKFVIK